MRSLSELKEMEIHSTQRSKRGNAMSRQIFSVVIVQGEWKISHGGRYHGSFPTQKAAAARQLTWLRKPPETPR
jgi:hypothetical protein